MTAMSTACVADSSDPSVDAEFARLAKKYAPLARERDESSSRDGVIVDETALEAAQMRIDAEYRTASAASEAEGLSVRDKAAVRVQLCPECKGNRVVFYEYNHRQMQRDCEKCDGAGTISYDKEGNVVRSVDDENRPSAPPPLVEPVFSPGQAAARRRAVLRSQIAKLQKQRASYHAEIAKLTQQADAPDATTTLHSLIAEVMRGIQGQLQKISAKIAELEKELSEGVDQGDQAAGPSVAPAATPQEGEEKASGDDELAGGSTAAALEG